MFFVVVPSIKASRMRQQLSFSDKFLLLALRFSIFIVASLISYYPSVLSQHH